MKLSDITERAESGSNPACFNVADAMLVGFGDSGEGANVQGLSCSA
jgi:hypothetical protein